MHSIKIEGRIQYKYEILRCVDKLLMSSYAFKWSYILNAIEPPRELASLKVCFQEISSGIMIILLNILIIYQLLNLIKVG